jgi:DNA mismatch endonuclease, patch repair protein
MTPIMRRRRIKPRDPRVTSRIMSAVRSRDSQAEILLRRELWKRGLRYRLHVSKAANERLLGRPDIVFVGVRVIAFLDSDFWHGRILRERGHTALARQFRSERRAWWTAKIAGNAKRDVNVTANLRRAGWRVIRVWESDVLSNPANVAATVARVVEKRRAALGKRP